MFGQMKVFITNYTFRQLLTDKDVKKIKVDWGVLEPFIKYLDNDSRKLFERMKVFLDDLDKSDVKGRQEKSEPWVNLSKGLRYHTENTCEFLHKDYTNWPIPKRIDPELYDDYRLWFMEHIHKDDFHRLFIKKWGFEFNESEVTRKNSGNFSLTSKSVDEIVKELRGYLNNLEDWLKKDDNESYFNTFKKMDFKVHHFQTDFPFHNTLNPLDKPKLDEFIQEYQLPIKNLVETVLHFQFGNYFTGKESELEKLGIKICGSCNANVLYEKPLNVDQEKRLPDSLNFLDELTKEESLIETIYKKTPLKIFAKHENLQSFVVNGNGVFVGRDNQNKEIYYVQSQELTKIYDKVSAAELFVSKVSNQFVGYQLVHTSNFFRSYYPLSGYWVLSELSLKTFIEKNDLEKYEFELTHVHNKIYVCIRFDSKKHYPYGDYSIPYSFTYMVEEELLKYDWPNISSSGLLVKNIGLPNGDTSTVIGI